MTASMTALPVLGVPIESQALKGMDSLLSIVQMPAGIPVGTLAIGKAGAINAALLAAAMLATSDDALGRAARSVARKADGFGGRSARMIVPPGSAPSASSAAASSAGCSRSPRPSSATAAMSSRPHAEPPAAQTSAGQFTRAAYDDCAALERVRRSRRRRDL